MPDPPLELLQITSSSEIGGAEQIALNLVRYGDSSRISHTILSLMHEGPLTSLAQEAGARSVGWGLRRMANPYLFRRMHTFVREGRFDLVQCYGLRADLLARGAARRLGVKLISMICSIDPHRRSYQVKLDRITSKGVTRWISTSDAARKARMEREGFPGERIEIVQTGLPDRPLADLAARQAAREKLRIAPEEGPVLAVVANVRPAKGHIDLIEALARLKDRWPSLICLCAGRDDSGGEIAKAAASRGLQDRIRWLGFQLDPGPLYDAADLYVLPSHWEGMPLVLIEALRAGLAAVATDVGGVGEVVRHEREGLLCAPRSPRSLAEAIARALEDEEARKAWGRAARQRFEESFGVERMVERFTEIHESVARPVAS